MAQFQNDELEYVVDDYFDVAEFEDNDAFAENQLRGSQDADSDLEDDFDEAAQPRFSNLILTLAVTLPKSSVMLLVRVAPR
ncbi:hypothetical protein ACE6H2_006531 [Prunus campanulata]